MSKVGILSMQRIYNYGSFLQAYSLKAILNELNCEVEFVDYHVGTCLVSSDKRQGAFRKIAKVMEVLCHRAPLKEKIRFIKYKKNYAKNYYPYLGIGESYNYTPKLDLLIIGSDEVFNCVQNNVNVGYSPELFGANSQARRLISYAASFGNTTLKKLEQYKVKDEVASLLNKFDALSVRDINTREVVQALIGKKPECYLDPVLVYDLIGKCEYIPPSVSESKYMVLYGYSGRFSKKECDAIRAYADKYDLKIFCIGGVQDCCDKFIDCSPFEVISYFQHADVVVTDTFHGTIMSVITHQRFAVFIRSSGYGNAEKLMDLSNRLHLNNRIIYDLNQLETVLDVPVHYEDIDKIILKERKHTYEYLRKEIELCTQS